MTKIGKIMIGLAFIFTLYACGKDNVDVHEQISAHLEATVEIERSFEEHQEIISELEKEDEEIYNEIIGLGSDDFDEVISLTEKAIILLDEREEQINLEKESLQASRAEFEQIEQLIEKITDAHEREQTEKLYETMINRYDAYEQVYASYIESLEMTKELYEIFQEEEFTETKVYATITNVNDSYEEVITANEQFNKETVLYNQLKQAYYEMIQGEQI